MRTVIKTPDRYQETYFRYGNAVVDVYHDAQRSKLGPWCYLIRCDAKMGNCGYETPEDAFTAAEKALEERFSTT